MFILTRSFPLVKSVDVAHVHTTVTINIANQGLHYSQICEQRLTLIVVLIAGQQVIFTEGCVCDTAID